MENHILLEGLHVHEKSILVFYISHGLVAVEEHGSLTQSQAKMIFSRLFQNCDEIKSALRIQINLSNMDSCLTSSSVCWAYAVPCFRLLMIFFVEVRGIWCVCQRLRMTQGVIPTQILCAAYIVVWLLEASSCTRLIRLKPSKRIQLVYKFCCNVQ